MADEPEKAPGASGAGRGVLYIAFAKFYFIFVGALIQVSLAGILSRAMVGAYGTLTSWVSPLNNVMVTGSIQAVSRFTAQRPEHARLVQAAGLRMHFYIGVPVALLFLAGAPIIAHFQHDDALIAPLMLAAAIVAGYSFYAVFVGTANGQRQFHKQAGLDIMFATMRAVGILGMAAIGAGVFGMIGGWVAAVGAILLIAALWVGMPGRDNPIAKADRLPAAPMAKFFIGVAIYLALFNVLMFVDTWLLKRLSTEYFAGHRAELDAALRGALPWVYDVHAYDPPASTLADVQVAYYTQVQFLARLSYQAIIAATFVVFPLVSKSTFVDDRDTTRQYIQVTMRYSLMFATALAVVMAANPTPLLDVIYPLDYAELGGPALTALALGNVAFSVFAIGGTLLNGAGFTRHAILTALITLIVAVVGNFIAIPMVAPGRTQLLVTASVTSGAMLIGAIASGWIVYRKLGAFIPLTSVVRVVIAVAVALAAGRVIPFRSPLMSLVEAAVIGVVFLAALVATRELGKKDLALIRRVRSKRGQAGGGEP
jgi:stage V sporulation protein B